MGPALKQDGTPAGTVTTPEGWVVYNSSTYHSGSGESANAYDDNHLLFFKIDALNPDSQNFNLAAYNYFTSSTRLISVQSYNDTTAGIPQLSNDANAPVSVYRDSVTSAFVAGPRPLGSAMDAGAIGQLIQSSGPSQPVVMGSAVQSFSATTLVVGVTGQGETGFTHAVELSKDWPAPGGWEKIGELEMTNALSTVVLNLNTNLPPRVPLRLKWPP